MRQFNIFKKSSGEVEAIKRGWSWPASLFLSFWALSKRLWVTAIGWFLAGVALSYLPAVIGVELDSLDSIIGIVFGVLQSLVFGGKANSWREVNLRARGYELVDTVTASNPEGALALFRTGKE